jgi:hypothetical protein
MKAKTDIHIYHNSLAVVNQKAFDENILFSIMDRARMKSQNPIIEFTLPEMLFKFLSQGSVDSP